jgi:steroid 5-alpha reductase family enzyme
MNALVMSAIALVSLGLVFAAVYFVGRRIDNYGVVDVAWSYAFGGLAVFYAVAGEGWFARRGVIASMVVLWSLRLGTHLWRRVQSHHPVEDGRYGEMRERWRGNFAPRMFLFFQLQALSVVVLGVPFLFAVGNDAPGFHWLEIAGITLWLCALAGETIADTQLAAFKRDTPDRRAVCDAGLWRYSRHPNYFFEWLVWVAYFLVGLAAPWGWTGLVAPAAILYLILNVTGVPPTEAQALRTRGAAYARYQQTTSAFFPWRPRPLSSRAKN